MKDQLGVTGLVKWLSKDDISFYIWTTQSHVTKMSLDMEEGKILF